MFRRQAELDLEAIEDWYDARRQGLGAEFREAAGELIARIADNPQMYQERYRGLRRAILRRFPYVLWYRAQGASLVVLACVHGSRDPRSVRSRLRADR